MISTLTSYLKISHYLYPRLKCLYELLPLHQVVTTEPTHSSSCGNQNLIDHMCFCQMSHILCLVLCTLPPLGNNCVDLSLHPSRANVPKKLNTQHTIWKYALADFERTNEMLNDMNVVKSWIAACIGPGVSWSKTLCQ